MDTVEALDAEKAKEVAIGLTLQSQVNPRRTIIMQTAIARDAPVKELHALADKLSAIVDRQEARFDLEGVMASIEADERSLASVTDRFQNIAVLATIEWKKRGKRGEPTLNNTEEQAKVSCAENIKALRVAIEKKRGEAKELEAKIAKVD